MVKWNTKAMTSYCCKSGAEKRKEKWESGNHYHFCHHSYNNRSDINQATRGDGNRGDKTMLGRSFNNSHLPMVTQSHILRRKIGLHVIQQLLLNEKVCIPVPMLVTSVTAHERHNNMHLMNEHCSLHTVCKMMFLQTTQGRTMMGHLVVFIFLLTGH